MEKDDGQRSQGKGGLSAKLPRKLSIATRCHSNCGGRGGGRGQHSHPFPYNDGDQSLKANTWTYNCNTIEVHFIWVLGSKGIT